MYVAYLLACTHVSACGANGTNRPEPFAMHAS